MLKILQARIQQHVNQKLPDVQGRLEKAEEPDQIANIHWIIENAREIKKKEKKTIYFCFINYVKAFDCVNHSKLQNSSIDGNTRGFHLPHEKLVCRSRSNS